MQRRDSLIYALLFALGIGFFEYSFLIRANIWSDSQGLHAHHYVLDSDYTWRNSDAMLPELDLYLHSSLWWQQFEPGDSYEFDLRHGGLGCWLVNMERIYTDQQEFYQCHGVLECMQK